MTSLAPTIEKGRSGVYRADAARLGRLRDLAHAAGLALHRVDLSAAEGKPAILAALSAELRFPAWVGANWDALQDALCDLSWLPENRGIVLVLDGTERLRGKTPGELDMLVDVLSSTAASWATADRAFIALVTGSTTPGLPVLR